MSDTFKTIKLNLMDSRIVASHLKIPASKIRDCYYEELLWEITKKHTKGLSKETLIELAEEFSIEITSQSISTIKRDIEQYLSARSLSLVLKSMPSAKEISEERAERAKTSNTTIDGEELAENENHTSLPEVKQLTLEESRRYAILSGFKGAYSSNKLECIEYISKQGLKNLEVHQMQFLCEAAGLKNYMFETSKAELRYGLLNEAPRKNIAFLPERDWETLGKEYDFTQEQKQEEKKKIAQEKAALAEEKLRLKEQERDAKERLRQSVSREKERVRNATAQERLNERERARIQKQQQAQAKKNAKAVGKLFGSLGKAAGKGIGSMFKETKAQKAHRKWVDRWK